MGTSSEATGVPLVGTRLAVLAGGACKIGLHKLEITPSSKEPMAGFSWSGSRGTPDGENRLWARALYLEDLETQQSTVLCIIDLMSASLALVQRVEQWFARNHPELCGRLVLSGTHTHTAPGRFYGNRFYDRLGAPLALCGFNARLTADIATKIATACSTAARAARPGYLSVRRGEVWGASRNRSIVAHRANATDPETPPIPWVPPPGLIEEQAAIDPRLTVLCAYIDGLGPPTPQAGPARSTSTTELAGVFAWFGCHGTALGRKWKHYHRDWLGFAVDAVEAELQRESAALMCAVGSAATGDATPLPVGADANPDAAQGVDLARQVGERVASELIEIARLGVPRSPGRLELRLDSGVFQISPESSVRRWEIGVPALAGATDGGPSFRKLALVAPGYSSHSGPQRPKAPALGFLQWLTLGTLDIARHHPWYRLWLGDHLLCTVPGEPTTMAALTLETQVQKHLRASSVSIIGYSGDYCGYFTTQAEYEQQCYEGASTLYGPRSLEWYRDQLVGPTLALPAGKRERVLPRGNVPPRNLGRLLRSAHELGACPATTQGPPRPTELLFALPAPPIAQPRRSAPRVWLVGSSGAIIPGIARRYPHPDPEGSPRLETFVAVFAGGVLDGAGTGTRLFIGDGGATSERRIVTAQAAEANGRLPESVRHTPLLLRLSRQLLVFAAAAQIVAFPLLFFPAPVLAWLGWGTSSHTEHLFAREVALTFQLLAINLFVVKNSSDRRALSGYSFAGSAFVLAIGTFFERLRQLHLLAGLCVVAALILFSHGWRSARRDGSRHTPHKAYWEFWTPLFWIGLLTAIVGSALIFWPHRFTWFFASPEPSLPHWLQLFGAGFIANTIVMWRAQYTRDLTVVRAQLWGSMAFDAITAFLLALAVGGGSLKGWGVFLITPFLFIVAWFGSLARRARARANLEIERPRTAHELARIVRNAALENRLVRVIGSHHSVPSAIYADAPPHPQTSRPSDDYAVHVSLERLDRILDVDRAQHRITVQAGMRIGIDPGYDPSLENNLLLHLQSLQWALPDLGGIVHQTVGGFLATGSSGGSLQGALSERVVELRFVDGAGKIRVLRRNNPRQRARFNALLVNLGLLGIITEVTFKCEEAYWVSGRESTAPVVEGFAQVPADPERGLPERQIDLRSPGPEGLAAYLKDATQREFCRILWWPQAKLSSMVIWEGRRIPNAPEPAVPYEPPTGWMQWIGGRGLELVGWSFGVGERRILGRCLRRLFLPFLARQFFPKRPKPFAGPWDQILPMDTNVDDAFLPVDFTELWFDIAHTHEVMKALLELYKSDSATGTFAAELYAAKASEAWLSPAYRRDSFRVDIFWYHRNAGDPVIDYYPQFYEKLGGLAFRAHWGKYLPRPGSAQGASYLTRQYPQWAAFEKLRRRLDPKDTFLSMYWRRQLGI